jgi:hypothetical protein
MKIKYAIIAATIIATTTVISVKTFKESTPLFDANVEALAEQENPGEGENCEKGGERCCYYYEHRNYNTEGLHNKN